MRFPSITFPTSNGVVTFTVAPRGLQVTFDSANIFGNRPATVRCILETEQRLRLRQFLVDNYPEDQLEGGSGWPPRL